MAVTFRLPSRRRSGTSEPGEPGRPVKALSSRSGSNAGCLVFFFAVFLLFGLGFLSFFAVAGAKVVAARAWRETPCRILASAVETHSGDDSDTYSVAVRYAYVVDGREYTAERFRFLGGSSSGRGAKEEVVRRLPPGTRTVCWVDPDDPAEAVLDRGFSAGFLFALIPLVFVAIGGGGIYWALGPGRRSLAARADGRKAWLPAAALEPEAAGELHLPTSGPEVLKPAHTPLGRFVGSLLITLFWNGIVGVFVWRLYGEWRAGSPPEGCAVAFLSVFVLIGLFLLINVPYQLLAMANPRPRLTLSRKGLPLGAPVQLEWQFSGLPGRIRALHITVEGREEATYRRGTRSYTDRDTFATLELVSTELPSMIPSGVAAFSIPAGSMHSFAASHNEVIWTLKLHGDVKHWPDVNEEFTLTVLPQEGLP